MKPSSRLRVTAPLALAGLSALSALGLGACSRGPIDLRIGVAMPLSGPLGAEGRNLVRAAQMAAEDIQAAQGTRGSGLPGARVAVRIIEADDQAEESGAVRAAEALMKQDVSAVVGHLTSACAIAAAPVYARGGVPQLSATTHPRLTQLGLRTTFRLIANDDMQARALARHAVDEFNDQGFAVVDDGSVYARGLADSVARQLGAARQPAALRHGYEAQATDFPELYAAIERRQVGVVITTMELAQVRLLLQGLVRRGLRQVAVLGGDTLKTGPLPPEAALVRRFVATTPVTEAPEFGGNGRTFATRYKARHHEPPADTAHYVYDAVHLLAQAAAIKGSNHGAVLAQALPQLDPAVPITGYLRFAADGEPRYGAISLYGVSKGQWRLIARSSDW